MSVKVNLRAIITADGEYIPFRNIESFNTSAKIPDTEQQLIDKLKDDFVVRIRTHAGYEYYCSMIRVMKETQNYDLSGFTPEDFFNTVVFECWMSHYEDKKK
jgi:hypothetical protein